MSSTNNMSTANNFGVMAKFIIEDDVNSELTEQLNFNLIEIPIPTFTVAPIIINRGDQQGSKPGTKLEKEYIVYGQVILDESMNTFFALQELMKKGVRKGKSNDNMIIQKLDNTNKVIAIGAYEKVWISSITGLRFNVQSGETITYIDVGFGFLDFDIKPL